MLALSGSSTMPFRSEKIKYSSEAWRNSEYPLGFVMVITINGTNGKIEGSIVGTPNKLSNSPDVSRSVASFAVSMSVLRATYHGRR